MSCTTCLDTYRSGSRQRHEIHHPVPVVILCITVLDIISLVLFTAAMIENHTMNKAYWAYQDATGGRGRWQDRPTYPPLNERSRDGGGMVA